MARSRLALRSESDESGSAPGPSSVRRRLFTITGLGAEQSGWNMKDANITQHARVHRHAAHVHSMKQHTTTRVDVQAHAHVHAPYMSQHTDSSTRMCTHQPSILLRSRQPLLDLDHVDVGGHDADHHHHRACHDGDHADQRTHPTEQNACDTSRRDR